MRALEVIRAGLASSTSGTRSGTKSGTRGRVRAALMDWLGVPIDLRNGTFWSEWFGVSASGKTVTVDAALQLAAVWACVRLLSETVSTLPLKVYRRVPDGSRELARDHPLYRLLACSPNAEMTPGRFMLFVVASLCLRGNAFVEKKRIAGRLVALNPLLPQNMVVQRVDGRLKYTYTEDGRQREIALADMMHIRGFGLDGVCGLQPIAVGRDVIGSAMSAEEAAAKLFAHGLQASGVVTHEDGKLSAAQRQTIEASLERFTGSNNFGKVIVLESGMKYQGITMNPEAAQMLQTRAMNVEQICSWFKVPPFMIGHMDKQSSWASSIERLNLHFLTHSLRPLLENIEQEIARCLIAPGERDTVYAEFSVEALLRADSAGRAAYYSTALQNGWMNRNTVARMENMPLIEGGDVYTVQANLVPLEQLGRQPAPAQAAHAAQAAMHAWLGALHEQTDHSDEAALAA